MIGADGMIAAGERSGAWPISLRFEDLKTVSGLTAPMRGLVASYQAHNDACLSVVGDKYRATTPEEWRSLVRAAEAAGARPTGAFALREGTRALATFEVGTANGLRTQLLLVDSFDGSMRLTVGTTSVRCVCANTVATALSLDGAGMAKVRHTSSMEQKVNMLAESITAAIAHGEKVRDAYHAAEATRLTAKQAQSVFDVLFPEAPEGSGKVAKTRADNVRAEAQKAMVLPINAAGPTVATLWNAATYLVDRRADGTARQTRGGDALDSLLFGARADRIQEIQTVVEVIMRDGTTQLMTAPKALEEGVDPGIIGRKLVDDMLADMS